MAFFVELLVLAMMAAPAFAWEDEGHMIVAAVAWDPLQPKTKVRVTQLLRLNKYPTNGLNDASAADAAKAAFMMASTAPDAIKGDTKDFNNDGDSQLNAQHHADRVFGRWDNRH